MFPIRIIPRLDIKGSNLVKGIHLEGLRVLGKPEQFAKYYYEQGADELLYMDVVASLYGRNSLLEIVEKTSKNIFIPLTVGGGIRTLEDIQMALRAGADKVAINTAAIARPKFIQEASNKFGVSTLVISIEAIRSSNGTYEAYTNNGREKTGKNAIEWAKEVADLGAGEILITSVDREGTGQGFDLELTKQISKNVKIPVVICGGGGDFTHVEQAIHECNVQAVSIASMFHYNFVKKQGSSEGIDLNINIKTVEGREGFKKIADISISEMKRKLIEKGISCRP